MLRKNIYIRKNRVTLSLLLVITGITSIFASELLFYTRLTNTALLSGIQKTIVYIMIFVAFLLTLTKGHSKMERVGNVLLVFTLFTMISTFFGVIPDIPFWRQAFHLAMFVSVFWTVYIATEQFGRTVCVKIANFSYILMVLIYLIAFFVRKKIDGNIIYYLLMFLPLTSMINSNILRKILYLLQGFAVLMSNKRTALIAFICYFLYSEWISNKKITGRKKVYKGFAYVLIVIMLCVMLPIIIQKLNITVFNELDVSHIIEDGGSNRLFIYKQLWNAQKNGDWIHWLIGSGYNSVLLSGICTDGALGGYVSAHSDFLEVLYDYGILGLIIYISFFICIIRKAIKMKKEKYKYAVPFSASVLMVFLISLTSHLVIYLNYYATVFVFWALCLADYRYGEKNEQKRKKG